jgi:hypothetical protein
MGKELNISVLVAARDEYIDQLKCILTPLIVQGFNSIYTDAQKFAQLERKGVLYKFQELVKEIPKWNQTILSEESKRIKKKCPYIMDIVTAIFVSNVKILASIRMKGKNENIRIKIPSSDIFIHSIYIESGQQFFYNPHPFNETKDYSKIQNNKETIYSIIGNCIEETIRQMLPFDKILQEYLANALGSDVSGTSESESESESDSDEESLHGNDINGSEVGSDEPEDPEDFDEIEGENNVKNVHLENDKKMNNIYGPQFINEHGEDQIDEPDESDEESSENQFGNNNFINQPQFQQPVQPQFQQPVQQQPVQQQPVQQQPVQQQPVQQQPVQQQPVQQQQQTYSFF